MTPESLLNMRFSDPHMNVAYAFVVRDHRRREFATVEEIRKIDNLRIAILRDGYFNRIVKRILPDANVVPIDSPEEFFTNDDVADALLKDAEGGAAWVIRYPGFRVVVPEPVAYQPLAFAVNPKAEKLADFLSHWIRIKKAGGAYEPLYDYWIRGKGAQQQTPRWSVIRNVLGWVK